GTLLADAVPAGGYLVTGEPERVLVLVVAQHLVSGVVVHHTSPSVPTDSPAPGAAGDSFDSSAGSGRGQLRIAGLAGTRRAATALPAARATTAPSPGPSVASTPTTLGAT